MSALYRDPKSRSQNFAFYRTPDLPVDKYAVVRQSHRARTLGATRRTSAVASLAVMAVLAGSAGLAVAQNAQADSSTAARAGAITHAQKMRRLFPDIGGDTQATPPVIPQLEIDLDPGGAVATFQPYGPTVTANNAFFQNLGTNGRTCFTCHQPEDAWSISAQHVRDRFHANSNDPLFRLFDGATCPSDDVSTPSAKRKAYSLVLAKGLIRIGLPMPTAGLEFQITDVNDPYGCNTNPLTGLTGSTAGTVSAYRRPLPSTNLGFLSTIMWDGREPSLFSQAVDATLGHAQATLPPTTLQQQQIVTFEGCTQADTPALCANTPAGTGVFTAQIFDQEALSLFNADARMAARSRFQSSCPISSSGLTTRWAKIRPALRSPRKYSTSTANGPVCMGATGSSTERQSIARGEQVFNTTKINITGVAGLNDALNQPSHPGVLRHLPRYAQRRQPFGQGATEHRRRECRCK